MAAIVAPARDSANINGFYIWSARRPGRTRPFVQKIREAGFCLASNDKGGSKPGSSMNTGFTKKGTHSVGVARQYCGRLGKQDNCQVAVTLLIANHSASLPIAYRLYLPETWANDAARRKKTDVLKDIRFKTQAADRAR